LLLSFYLSFLNANELQRYEKSCSLHAASRHYFLLKKPNVKSFQSANRSPRREQSALVDFALSKNRKTCRKRALD
jgi:hypothetical protein